MFLLLVAALAGCGVFEAITDPGPRPQLPRGDPWPQPLEAVIEALEDRGWDCAYEPESDIPGGWRCHHPEAHGGGLGGEEKGPVVAASAVILDTDVPPPAPEVMDARATAFFNDAFLVALLPEEVRPSDGELLAMIERNWPVELGDGWLLGFERASNNRTVRVVYVEPEGD